MQSHCGEFVNKISKDLLNKMLVKSYMNLSLSAADMSLLGFNDIYIKSLIEQIDNINDTEIDIGDIEINIEI